MNHPTVNSTPWADLQRPPDADRLCAALHRGLRQFADGTLVIEAVRISRVRRSSSLRRDPHPISMCIDLDVRAAADGRRTTQRFYAKAFRGGASATALEAIDRSRLVHPAQGDAVAQLPDLDMLIWSWPNDPGLPQLARLSDPKLVAHHLPASVVDARSRGVDVEVLRYEPERRATLRCHIRGPSAGSAAELVYGKTFADDQAERLLRRFQHFHALSQANPSAPLVAEPLGVNAPTRTLWQRTAPGQPLVTGDAAQGPDAAFAAIGSALAQVHRCELDEPVVRSTEFWLAELRRRAQKIGRAEPGLAVRAAALTAALEGVARRLPAARQTLIHGDFHPEQVCLAEDRVVFFDFDEFALGNPMEDLAEFIVKLEQLRQPAGRFEAQVCALLAGYQHAAPHLWAPDWLQWHRAVQTLLQASRAFIYQEPGWSCLLEARLLSSERLAAACRFAEAA
jgi:aminoglycoside phosphotransferase (APT) family kinase protein